MRKVTAILIVLALLCCTMAGCKKKDSGSVVKSAEEYQKQAEKEINAENMEAELSKIEEELKKESEQ